MRLRHRLLVAIRDRRLEGGMAIMVAMAIGWAMGAGWSLLLALLSLIWPHLWSIAWVPMAAGPVIAFVIAALDNAKE